MNSHPTPATWQQTGQLTTYRGHPLFFHDEGKGEPLLLIHGFPTSSWDWAKLWPDLTARYRVLAPDLLGFGFSGKPRHHPYSIHDQADLCEHLLRERDVRSCHLLVHDYGNTVAQELLARFADRIKTNTPGLAIQSCCFLNGGLFPEMHRALLIQKLLNSPLGPLVSLFTSRQTVGRFMNRVYGPAGIDPAELDGFWQIIKYNNGHRLFHKLIHYINDRRQHRDRWVSVLQTTSVPLRLIDGPEDPVSGRHMAEYYRQLVPAPDIVLLPEIGHYPQTESPQAVSTAYEEFRSALQQR